MIITRTPYRVSLFGGGTDYPDWYHKYKGAVLSFTINKYSYITLRELPPFFEHNYRISYSKIEITKNISDIEHPAVRVGFRKYASEFNLELHHHGDLPSRSGIGSSSAFAVGLINALSCLRNKDLDSYELAKMAIEFEQVDLGEVVGSQDQIACAVGGFNFIEFGIGEKWIIRKLKLPSSYLKNVEDRMVLLYSGVSRISSLISKSLIENMDSKINMMQRTYDLANKAFEIFNTNKEPTEIGPMLKESWELKKLMNPNSVTTDLETFFKTAYEHGALGGKILGAGGGGFCLFWVDPDIKESFIHKMKPALNIPFNICDDGAGRIL